MVYSQVDIYRGVIISQQQLIDYANRYFDKAIEIKDLSEHLYEIIDLLNQNSELTLPKKLLSKFKFRKISPCCSDNMDVIFGVCIKTYKRKRLNKEECLFKFLELEKKESINSHDKRETKEEYEKFKSHILKNLETHQSNSVFCGKLCDNGTYRCGYLTVCDDCLKITVNGEYNINRIFNKTVEVKEQKEQKEKDENENITCEMFIDELILQACEDMELVNKDGTSIKNYYCVDDCLSCS